ncbi:hypothetical protein SAMN05216359_1292 [Roseateles sp. YR242]|uniref:hypothetical protein n=1 Tax=Roseateles sp. YR242 TaxID=1855305 RepID=UPI0008C8B2BD|nr:hypothetical protein [Roseateles sp. YR242]SEL93569.1 hypothetical protein SAMN05216359_1292 [Roseateles sp. YR242]
MTSSILQVFKMNEPKTGISVKTGKAWSMQTAECALCDEAGVILEVGTVRVTKELEGTKPGTYSASFSLRRDYKTGEIGAMVTALTPYPPQRAARAPAPATAAV